MNSIGFFTPVIYDSRINKTKTEKAAVFVDHYFWLGGKKASIILSETRVRQTHILNHGKAPFIRTALKVLSYCTVVIPLLMLVVKAALRCSITIPKQPNRISPYAHQTLGLTKREINLCKNMSLIQIAVLNENTIKSLNTTMNIIAEDIISEINAYFVENGSDLETAVVRLNKVPGAKEERNEGFTSLFVGTKVNGEIALTPEDSSTFDVVMKALKNKGYINNYNYIHSKDNRTINTVVISVPK